QPEHLRHAADLHEPRADREIEPQAEAQDDERLAPDDGVELVDDCFHVPLPKGVVGARPCTGEGSPYKNRDARPPPNRWGCQAWPPTAGVAASSRSSSWPTA